MHDIVPSRDRELVPKPAVSAFFLAYNDAPTIAAMVTRAMQTLETFAADYEVIVVDDGSRDATAEILESLVRDHPHRLRIVRHSHNRGYGAAVRSGIAAASKDWVFYTDGDAQYDPREIVFLNERLAPDVDLVNGYKLARSDPFHRKAIGWAYNRAVRFIFGVHLRDVDCDFRLMRRQLFEQIELTSTSGTIGLEMIKKLQDRGCRMVEVPVHHFQRSSGRSQFFRPRHLLQTAVELLALWRALVIDPPPSHALPKSGARTTSQKEPGI